MNNKPKRTRSPYYHWRVRELLPEIWETLRDEPSMVACLIGHELIYLSRMQPGDPFRKAKKIAPPHGGAE
jgi:hypothetical protein